MKMNPLNQVPPSDRTAPSAGSIASAMYIPQLNGFWGHPWGHPGGQVNSGSFAAHPPMFPGMPMMLQPCPPPTHMQTNQVANPSYAQIPQIMSTNYLNPTMHPPVSGPTLIPSNTCSSAGDVLGQNSTASSTLSQPSCSADAYITSSKNGKRTREGNSCDPYTYFNKGQTRHDGEDEFKRLPFNPSTFQINPEVAAAIDAGAPPLRDDNLFSTAAKWPQRTVYFLVKARQAYDAAFDDTLAFHVSKIELFGYIAKFLASRTPPAALIDSTNPAGRLCRKKLVKLEEAVLSYYNKYDSSSESPQNEGPSALFGMRWAYEYLLERLLKPPQPTRSKLRRKVDFLRAIRHGPAHLVTTKENSTRHIPGHFVLNGNPENTSPKIERNVILLLDHLGITNRQYENESTTPISHQSSSSQSRPMSSDSQICWSISEKCSTLSLTYQDSKDILLRELNGLSLNAQSIALGYAYCSLEYWSGLVCTLLEVAFEVKSDSVDVSKFVRLLFRCLPNAKVQCQDVLFRLQQR